MRNKQNTTRIEREKLGSLKRKKTCKFSPDKQHKFKLVLPDWYGIKPGVSIYEYYNDERKKAEEVKEKNKYLKRHSLCYRLWGENVLYHFECEYCKKKRLETNCEIDLNDYLKCDIM